MMHKLALCLVVLGVSPPGRYTVATETVTDTKTGLVWQRAVASGTYNWQSALAYCNGLTVTGFSSGWRLPSVKELATLVDERARPTLDSAVFPNTPMMSFWTGTPAYAYPDLILTVDFGTGDSVVMSNNNTLYVRCVH
jgi:hypothetical protein